MARKRKKRKKYRILTCPDCGRRSATFRGVFICRSCGFGKVPQFRRVIPHRLPNDEDAMQAWFEMGFEGYTSVEIQNNGQLFFMELDERFPDMPKADYYHGTLIQFAHYHDSDCRGQYELAGKTMNIY